MYTECHLHFVYTATPLECTLHDHDFFMHVLVTIPYQTPLTNSSTLFSMTSTLAILYAEFIFSELAKTCRSALWHTTSNRVYLPIVHINISCIGSLYYSSI